MSQPQFSNNTDLIALLQRKDKTGLEMLYDKYSPALYGYIRERIDDEPLASLLLEKAFVKIWKECSSINCMNHQLFSWVYSICKKTVLEELDHRKVGIYQPSSKHTALYKSIQVS